MSAREEIGPQIAGFSLARRHHTSGALVSGSPKPSAPVNWRYDREPRTNRERAIKAHVDESLVERAYDNLRTLPLAEIPDLIIALAFGEAVQEAGGGPAYARSRPLRSAAAGKFIPSRNGRPPTIVLDAQIFTTLTELAAKHETDPLWIAAHEGWHAILNQRGEDVFGLKDRLTPDQLAWHFGPGIQFLEEFRVERQLQEERRGAGHEGPQPDGQRDDFKLFRDAMNQLETAPRQPARGDDFFHSGLGICHAMAELVGALAALEVVWDAQIDEQLQWLPWWRTIGRPYWIALIDLLRQTPGAAQQVTPAELDPVVEGILDQAEQWMTHLSTWAKGVPRPGDL
jgi:hypothetical protein